MKGAMRAGWTKSWRGAAALARNRRLVWARGASAAARLTCRPVLVGMALLPLSKAISAQPVAFTDAERARVLSHGPWPPSAKPDPSNRVSGSLQAVAFGRMLFFDTGLSRFGALSCASCHKPGLGWGDGRSQASSAARLDRNTLPLYNLRYMRWYGWDGASDSLWMHSIRPLLDPREMAATAEHVHAHVGAKAPLAAGYRASFGTIAAQDPPEVALVNVGKALAAFQETLVTVRTPFDVFRDALGRGDLKAMARYPAAAQRGLKTFVGKGNCSLCHSGPMFSNGEFHDIGLSYFTTRRTVDPGRHGGIVKLRESPFNRLGVHSDDASHASAWATRHVVQQHRSFGEFKVPSLRNVALTGPYMHNGSKSTLADVVRHYSEVDEDRLHVHGEAILRRLGLTPAESADLVAFLESLTEIGKSVPMPTRAK